jgi:hypothetical protein
MLDILLGDGLSEAVYPGTQGGNDLACFRLDEFGSPFVD